MVIIETLSLGCQGRAKLPLTYAYASVISLQPYGQCRVGLQGLEIIDSHLGSMALFQPQDAYCPGLGLQISWIGGAARIDDPDIAITLDSFDMGMSTHDDVGMAAEVVLHRALDRPVRHLYRIEDFMYHPHGPAMIPHDLSFLQPWVCRHDGATARATVPIAARRQHWRDLLQPIEHR